MNRNKGRPRNKRKNYRSLLVALAIAIVVFAGLGGYFVYQAFSSAHSSSNVSTTSSFTSFSTPYIKEFDLSSKASPNGIAVDSSGNVWFVAQGNDSLGVVWNSNSSVELFPVPTNNVTSWGVAIDNSRNVVWFTDESTNAVWSFNITSRQFHEYALPANPAFPYQVAIDQSHNAWFTELFSNELGEILASNGSIAQYPIPAPLSKVSDSGPTGLTIAPNGTVWFADPLANSIGRFANGNFQAYNFTGQVLSPVGVSLDSQGNVWFTQHGPSLVSEFFPANGTLKTISTSLAPSPLDESLPYFCYVDSQGNVWFNEHQGNRIGKYSPASGEIVEYAIPSGIGGEYQGLSGSLTMALSPSGTPWFAEQFAGKIATVASNLPVNESISIQPSSLVFSGNATSRVFNLQLTAPAGIATHVNASISTLSLFPPVTFAFSRTNGTGDYSSTLTVNDKGLSPGNYYVTVGIFSQDVIVSQVIEVKVQ